MKQIVIPVAGFVVALFAAVSLGQLIAVALLVHAMTVVLSGLGNLF